MNNIEKTEINPEYTRGFRNIKLVVNNILHSLSKSLGNTTSNNPYAIKNPREMPPRDVYLSNNRVISEKEVNDYINSI